MLKLGPLLERQLRALSLGERMRVGLAMALIYRPEVLFLDEPTSGSTSPRRPDPRVRRGLRAAEPARRCLLTSHYMADVASLCPRLILIDQGRVEYDGDRTR